MTLKEGGDPLSSHLSRRDLAWASDRLVDMLVDVGLGGHRRPTFHIGSQDIGNERLESRPHLPVDPPACATREREGPDLGTALDRKHLEYPHSREPASLYEVARNAGRG